MTFENGKANIYRHEGVERILVSSHEFEPMNGDTVKLESAGSTLTAYVEGIQMTARFFGVRVWLRRKLRWWNDRRRFGVKPRTHGMGRAE